MVFGITSFLLIIGLSLRLTFGRYLSRLPGEKRGLSADNLKGYFRWIIGWKKSFLRLERWDRCLDYLIAWGQKNFSGWTVWIFYALVLSYIYLALSGFIFAWLVGRGLYGFPLLLHVAAGALFAISLTVVLFIKARFFMPEKLAEEASRESGRGFYCPLAGRSFPRIYLQAIAFWLFVLAGFFLVASTLSSMLPYFNYPAQIFFFHLHRWSALVSVLAALLTVEVIFVD